MTSPGRESTPAIQDLLQQIVAEVRRDELERIAAEVRFEDFLSMASQVMEMHEMFDHANPKGSEYAQGYRDGFWAGRELDFRHRRARIESITQKLRNTVSVPGVGEIPSDHS